MMLPMHAVLLGLHSSNFRSVFYVHVQYFHPVGESNIQINIIWQENDDFINNKISVAATVTQHHK